MLKFKTFKFNQKYFWNWSFFHYEKIMRFKKKSQLSGAGRTRAWHHHGSHTPTSPGSIFTMSWGCWKHAFGIPGVRPMFLKPKLHKESKNGNFSIMKGSDHLAHSWGGLGRFLGSQWDRQLKFSAYASFLILWSHLKFELIWTTFFS